MKQTHDKRFSFEINLLNIDSPHVKSGNFGGIFSSAMRAISSQSRDNQGNLDQQGGTLIIGPTTTVHYFHRDKTARDHTPINKLLKLVGAQPIDFEKERMRSTLPP